MSIETAIEPINLSYNTEIAPTNRALPTVTIAPIETMSLSKLRTDLEKLDHIIRH